MSTNDTRVINTQISGSSMQSNLTGDDIRLLEFDAANKRTGSLYIYMGNNSLNINQLLQATIDTQLLNTIPFAGTGTINVGSDYRDKALSYISFFNFQNTNEERLLRLTIINDCNGVLSLSNDSLTTTHIKIREGVNGFPQISVPLFDNTQSLGSGPYSYGAGSTRTIVVKADDLTSGSEAISFCVLPYSM